MNKSSPNNMKDNIMRVPDDHRNKNLSEETNMFFADNNDSEGTRSLGFIMYVSSDLNN